MSSAHRRVTPRGVESRKAITVSALRAVRADTPRTLRVLGGYEESTVSEGIYDEAILTIILSVNSKRGQSPGEFPAFPQKRNIFVKKNIFIHRVHRLPQSSANRIKLISSISILHNFMSHLQLTLRCGSVLRRRKLHPEESYRGWELTIPCSKSIKTRAGESYRG